MTDSCEGGGWEGVLPSAATRANTVSSTAFSSRSRSAAGKKAWTKLWRVSASTSHSVKPVGVMRAAVKNSSAKVVRLMPGLSVLRVTGKPASKNARKG